MIMVNPTLENIAGIPTVITENHHEVVGPWFASGLQHALLFHVDGHADMAEGGEYVFEVPSPSQLSISNFINPAVHHGVVDDVVWLNPHSVSRRLQDLGTRGAVQGRFRLQTRIIRGEYRWDDGTPDVHTDLVQGKGVVISPRQLKPLSPGPFILDVDLDAFCCHRGVQYAPQEQPSRPSVYDGVSDWEVRQDATIVVLRRVRRPDLITITRSQGYADHSAVYVPPELVSKVQGRLMEQLHTLYTK